MKILVMYGNHQPTSEHLRRLQAVGSEIIVAVADSEERAIEQAPSKDILLGHRYLRQILAHAHRLRWVQSYSAGIDHLISPELLNRPIFLTRAPIFAEVVARHAYILAWALIRRIPEFFYRQTQGIWDPSLETLPLPRTALIVGFGSVGRAVGKLLKRDGLKVWGVKRTLDQASREFCDELHSTESDSWRELLPDADLCFLTLPLNVTTREIFDERTLRALPAHAVLVNVGRGGTLDAKALGRVLREGHLGGVGLDVTDPEPPSPEDHLRETPRVLITPHVAARHPGRWPALEEFSEQQLIRYLNCQQLEGTVNPLDLLIPENPMEKTR